MLENKELEALVTKTTEHQESVIAMIDLQLEHASEIDKLATQAGDLVVDKSEEDQKRAIIETMRDFAKDIRQRHHNYLASPKSLVAQIDDSMQTNATAMFETDEWAALFETSTPRDKGEKLIREVLTSIAKNIATSMILDRGE